MDYRHNVLAVAALVAFLAVACGGGPAPTLAPQPAEPPSATPAVVPSTIPSSGQAPAAPGPVPSITASPSAVQQAGRPIVYFAGQTIGEVRGFVTRGVYADGEPWVTSLPASGVAWSPRGTRLAYVDAAHPETLQVLIRTGATQPVFRAREGERLVPWPAWAPDGIRAAVLIRRDGDPAPPASLAVIAVPPAQLLSRYDLPAETIRLPSRTKPLNAFHWSADGQRILVAWENAVVLDTREGKISSVAPDFVIAEWAAGSATVNYFTVVAATGSDGARLGGFYATRLDGAAPVELASEEQLASLGLRPMEGSYGIMALAPDGKQLAIALGTEKTGVSTVRIYDDVRTRLEIARPTAVHSAAGTLAALEWAPDGRELAAVAVLPEGAVLQVLDVQTGLWHSPLLGSILQPDEFPVLGYIRVLSWGGG